MSERASFQTLLVLPESYNKASSCLSNAHVLAGQKNLVHSIFSTFNEGRLVTNTEAAFNLSLVSNLCLTIRHTVNILFFTANVNADFQRGYQHGDQYS